MLGRAAIHRPALPKLPPRDIFARRIRPPSELGMMPRPALFLPTARQTNWLLIVAFCAAGYALYLRYAVLQVPLVANACDAGQETWLCTSRKVANALFQHSVFGIVAIVAAMLNLLRPSIVLFAIALAARGLGIVLYNLNLSALAAALLVLSLARPAPATEWPPTQQ